MSKSKPNYNEKYVGDKDEQGLPNGKGILTIKYNNDNSIFKIEEGIWKNGFLVEGSETTYLLDTDRNFIKKEIGKWKYREEDNHCDEFISGEGEELYYRTEEDLKNNNFFGYVRGIFDDGSLIEGEILNPSMIDYSEEPGIKKIIYNKRVINKKTTDGSTNIVRYGKIFYEVSDNIDSNRLEGQGVEYEGEIDFDQPHGKGTMTFEDGSKKSGTWFEGSIDL